MILIIDCGRKKTPNISSVLTELGYGNMICSMDNILKGNFSKIIISGSPILLSEVDKKPILCKFKFIKSIKIPVLGICFGHQVIGLLYGSKISQGELISKEEKIEVIKEDGLFKGLNDTIFVENHCEFITLPKGFIHLAKSKSCNIEAIKNGNIYGVQFHPEVSGDNGKRLLKNFCEL